MGDIELLVKAEFEQGLPRVDSIGASLQAKDYRYYAHRRKSRDASDLFAKWMIEVLQKKRYV
jgi:hypothetical protein